MFCAGCGFVGGTCFGGGGFCARVNVDVDCCGALAARTDDGGGFGARGALIVDGGGFGARGALIVDGGDFWGARAALVDEEDCSGALAARSSAMRWAVSGTNKKAHATIRIGAWKHVGAEWTNSFGFGIRVFCW